MIMSLIGRRFSFSKNDDTFLWRVVDEDDEFLYVVYLPDNSGRIYKQLKSFLVRYPLYYMTDLQLSLF